ncbi:uncharacterized protein DUF4129 [Roseimicrobium gellanilyticum]|uniref:Uncharacterized protein DUF4129 n=1 Tax=Roseimicrobium gellanilyticum TaxID=748857 RepID=A0A366HIW2_9BACT|nr:DUF4129 domain-containing protein [Roseimicrobium gellanilyticum]RBP42602.1 uncharacterized protein DUF4129 [Roseimicrobium gellanilyticum]
MPKASTRDHRDLFTLVEEGTHLLRRAPASLWLVYYLGSIPFVIYLFYFWSDMSRSGFAEGRLLESSLLLALLYAFMKIMQAWFCDGLMGMVQGREQRDRMPLRGWLRLIASQMWVHATAPWVLVASLLSMLPLPWTYAFYHNVTVLAVDHFRRGGRHRALLAQAMSQTQWQFMQQISLLALLQVSALLVYLNIVIGIVMVMVLAKSLSGTDNLISLTQGGLIMSTPVQALIISLAYLVMNPVIKSIYVLRCFYGAARRSGADLDVRLRSVRTAGGALAALVLLMGSGTLHGAGAEHKPTLPERAPTVSSERLDRSIQDTLQQSEFEWRMPRENMKGDREDSFLGNIMRGFTDWLNASLEDIGKALGDFMDWLFGGKEQDDGIGSGGDAASAAGGMWVGFMPYLLLALGVVLLLALGWMLFRHWRQTRKTEVVDSIAVPEINLENENIVATQLPENEWLRLAREKIEAGDYRLALRALFLATLAHLGDKRLLHISRTKSNGDYVQELGWRAKGRSDLNESFHQQVRTFDRVWYGWHEVSPDLMTRFQEQHERITTHAT